MADALTIVANTGITPACAGNSTPAEHPHYLLQDHPRLRGEQVIGLLKLCYALGSPPLARGTVSRRYRSRRNGGDHPRLRGEQLGDVYKMPGGLGSPPLARGTVKTKIADILIARITPACAGNSTSSQSTGVSVGDHPRLRGEQIFMAFMRPARAGSPPLARGTVVNVGGLCDNGGITPACAGNRSWTCKKSGCQRDHPRLRGEQCETTTLTLPITGSPPLARGTVSV